MRGNTAGSSGSAAAAAAASTTTRIYISTYIHKCDQCDFRVRGTPVSSSSGSARAVLFWFRLRKGAKQPPVSRVSVVMPTARLRLLHAHLAPATATASATAEAAAAAAADTTIDQSESDRIAAEFQRTGVVVLPGFFAPPALAPLNDAIAQLVATTQPWSTDVASRRGPYKDKYKALFDTELVSLPFTANHPDAVAALLADRKLAAVTAAVLGADYTELGPMCFGCVAISVSRCLVRVLSVLSSTRWKESHRLTAWLSFHRRPLLLHV
jgi:hypothetical protein